MAATIGLSEPSRSTKTSQLHRPPDPCDVITQLIEFDQIATGSNSAFNQSPRRWAIFFQETDDQLPLGNVPPIVVFQCNKFLQVTWVHVVLPVVGAS